MVKIINFIGISNYLLKIVLKLYKKCLIIMLRGVFDWIYLCEGKMVFCWKYLVNILIVMLYFYLMIGSFEELFYDWDMVSK